MKKISSVIAMVVLSTSLLSVTACTNRDMATVGGGAVGGLVGYGVTGGSGVGTAVGAVGGAVIGNQLAR
ncbi:MAG: hypothetical protein P4M12_09360 [Gammaproteobacteria bacterium]|nr:hypothetical protein [Gammaproteobacteria bacterium]